MSKKLRIAIFKLIDILVIFTMVFASPMSLTASAMAQDSGPALTTDESDYEPGDAARVTGSSFPAGGYVLAADHDNDDDILDWGSVTVDDSGIFVTDSPELNAAGTYEVRAYASEWSGDWEETPIASATFTVTAPPPPTEEPTTTPTEEPTQEPTPEPTNTPTEEPTSEPTNTPTDEPTQEPTPEPTNTPTNEPTATEPPTAEPTNTPTDEPTVDPTQTATDEPTAEPTTTSTEEPTDEPTATTEPTSSPTTEPTQEPTPLPDPFIQSDKADYTPGELVTLTGGNWQGDSQVRIIVNDDIGQTWRREMTVEVAADGTIYDSFNLPIHFVANYSVIARGLQTNRVATSAFTDAPLPGSVSLVTWRTQPSGAWINGTLQANNSDYSEGETIPFRLELGTLNTANNPYVAPICRDYQLANGVFGFTTLQPFNTSRAATPGGTVTSTSGPFSGVNITITSVNETGVSSSGGFNCGSTQRLTIVSFNVSASGPQFLLWGGRLADPSDAGVGEGKSASFWSGGSLQMRLASPDKTSGIQPAAVVRLAKITVQKIVDSGSATPDQWCFNISPNPNGETLPKCPTAGTDTVTFLGLPTGNYQITETNVAGYTFASGTGTSCTFNGSTATASVTAAQNPNNVVNATCIFHNALQQGTITIIKDAVPDDSQDFSFTTSGTGLSNFSLDDDSDPALPNTKTFPNLVQGTYSVTEGAVTGWDLTSSSCTSSIGDTETAGSMELDAGETITCTFTNTKRGHIIVDKVTSPSGSSQSFNFDASGGTSPAYADFSLTDAATPNNQELKPGAYSVSETVLAGWDLTSSSCTSSIGDTETPANIELDAGETVTCTFTNTKQFGSIVVVKDTVPDDPQDFSFTGTGPGGFNFGGGFSLDDDGNNANDLSNTATFSSLNSGNYSISETPQTGFDTLSSCISSINDTETADSIELDPNETVTCTFINTKRGSIVIVKNTLGGDGTFDFTSTTLGDFSLTTSGGTTSTTFTNLNVDVTYDVDETVPAGWELNSAVCDSGETIDSIDLEPGETVTCTFENEKAGSIVIVKNTLGGDGTFDFTSTTLGAFQLTTSGSTASTTFSNLNADVTYDVDETVPAGWELNSATCDNGETIDSIDLEPGETVTCTFENEKAGSVVIVKNTLGGDGTFDFTSTTLGPFSLTTVGGTASTSFDTLDVDTTYDVDETIPAGWELNSAVCDNGETIDSIDLEPGETITCTFENEKAGSIVIVKNTLGGDGTFDFTSTTLGDFQLTTSAGTASTNFDNLDADLTYDVDEAVPAGWELNSAVCDNSDDPSAINLDPGETITCTFENEKAGSIVIVKNTLGGDGTFHFTSATLGAFQLTTSGGTAQTSFTNLDVDVTYDVDETVPAGWELNSAVCDSDETIDSIDLEPGETVTCTFEDEMAGSIVIVKNTLGGDGTFEFTSTTLGDFSLTTLAGTAQTSFTNLDVDVSYDVDETVPAGWELNSATCDNGETIDSIDLEPGETVTCTFEDEKAGSIVIVKNTLGGDGTFDFTSTTLGAFQLTTTGGTASTAFNNLDVDVTYDVDEVVPTGWELNSATCDDGSDPAAIDLEPGETVTCTFENERAGSIVIVKNTLGGDGTFEFTSTTLGPFSLTTTGGAASTTFDNLDVDTTYDVAETVPAGWELNSATCDNGETIDSIDLDPGETVTCTFENEKAGSIVIVKNTLGGDGTFEFTSATLGGFSLTTVTGTASTSFDNLDVDVTYDVAEILPAGWELNSATCDDGSDPAAIDLEPGETVTCTFENEKAGSIVIVKNTLGGDGTFDFTSTTLGDFSLTTVAGTASTTFNNLDVDVTYDVDETVPAGWELNSSVCDNGETVDSIDLEPGETVTCTFEDEKAGSIIIVKNTLGGDGIFEFTSTTLGDFSLATSGGTASTTFNNLDVDTTYDVDETVPAGWELNSATCDNGETIDSIELEPGETVTCTFENEKAGSIVIVKNTLGGDGTFDFTSTTLGDFSLTTSGGTASTTFTNVDVDVTYDADETVPTGWELNSATCDNGETIDSIDLEPGETVTCTFENEKAGSIVIVKNTLGGDGTFDFTSTTLGDFSLTTSAGTAQTSFNNLDVDVTYDVDETVPAGWELNSATCDNGETIDSIDLEPGETVTCTFENEKAGSIVIVKNTLGGDGTFDFTSTTLGNFQLTASGGTASTTFSDLDVDVTYDVAETVPAGWELNSATCDSGETIESIDLEPGETVTCTFENEKAGSIVIVKNTLGGDGTFDFTSATLGAFQLSTSGGTAQTSFNNLDVDVTYDVAETVPAGWELNSATCDSGETIDSIDLEPGETVTCTFENEKAGSIIIIKNTVGGDGTFDFTSNTLGNFSLTTASNTASQTFSNLDVDPTYDVAETVPSGWDLTSATCDNGETIDSIDLEPGETVTCTFTNTKRGHIIVDKVTLPSGDTQSFTFTTTGSGYTGFNLTDAAAPNDQALPPGTYSVTETVPAGWDLTGLTCSDPSGAPVRTGNKVTIDLAAGETVNCVFTNTKRGTITIIKDAVPNHAQDFSFTSTISGAASFILDDDPASSSPTNNKTVTNLLPGAYSVTEGAVAGWDLTGLTCNDANGTTNPGTRTANIVLDPGENVVCTFTNTKRGTIIVEKQTNPDGAPGNFAFTGTAAGTIADNGTITVSNLVPGTYTSTEANPAVILFALTSIVCNDGSSANPSTGNLSTRTATFKLDPGETVRCVFTNSKDFHPGTIGFWKNWRNHYTGAQVQLLINYLKTNNPKIYNKDLVNNNADDFTIAKWDAIFNVGTATPREQMILAQFTALKLNLAITQLDGTGGLVQKNNDLCTAGVVNVSSISGATAFFGISTPTVAQIVNAVESKWTGKLTTNRSDWKWNLNSAQKDMLIKVLSGINEGTLVMSSGCP